MRLSGRGRLSRSLSRSERSRGGWSRSISLQAKAVVGDRIESIDASGMLGVGFCCKTERESNRPDRDHSVPQLAPRLTHVATISRPVDR